METDAKRVLLGLLNKPCNRFCADCKSINLSWASINQGIFLCEKCAKIHDSLKGLCSQIKIKAVESENWEGCNLSKLKSIGNNKSNQYYEKKLPFNYHPNFTESKKRREFILDKYFNLKWADRHQKLICSPYHLSFITIAKTLFFSLTNFLFLFILRFFQCYFICSNNFFIYYIFD